MNGKTKSKKKNIKQTIIKYLKCIRNKKQYERVLNKNLDVCKFKPVEKRSLDFKVMNKKLYYKDGILIDPETKELFTGAFADTIFLYLQKTFFKILKSLKKIDFFRFYIRISMISFITRYKENH